MIQFFIGLIICLGGLIATSYTHGRVLFYGAIAVGLLNMLLGGIAWARSARGH